MRIRIHSHTQFDYDKPAVFSAHLVRLFPRPDLHLRVLKSKFTTSPKAWIYRQRDQFDNQIARCIYQKKGKVLKFDVKLDLEIQERSPFDFVIDLHAVNFPFSYNETERLALRPYLSQSKQEKASDHDLWSPRKKRTTVEALTELNQAIFKNLRYEYREQGDAYSPAETLQKQAGSCRDFSRLAASLLRGAGIAVRLVSGYAAELDLPIEKRRAEGSLHAWIEAYIPGAGWLGLNPTGGNLADHNLIPTAVGLQTADIAPTPGTFTGNQRGPIIASLTLSSIE